MLLILLLLLLLVGIMLVVLQEKITNIVAKFDINTFIKVITVSFTLYIMLKYPIYILLSHLDLLYLFPVVCAIYTLILITVVSLTKVEHLPNALTYALSGASTLVFTGLLYWCPETSALYMSVIACIPWGFAYLGGPLFHDTSPSKLVGSRNLSMETLNLSSSSETGGSSTSTEGFCDDVSESEQGRAVRGYSYSIDVSNPSAVNTTQVSNDSDIPVSRARANFPQDPTT